MGLPPLQLPVSNITKPVHLTNLCVALFTTHGLLQLKKKKKSSSTEECQTVDVYSLCRSSEVWDSMPSVFLLVSFFLFSLSLLRML